MNMFLFLLLVCIDLSIKIVMHIILKDGGVVLSPFSGLVIYKHTGSFFIPDGYGIWLHYGAVILMTTGMSWLVYCHNNPKTFMGLLFILAGAAANLSERLFYGHVTDFFFIGIPNVGAAILNLADLYVVVGVGIYLWGRRQQSGTNSGAR